MVRLILVLMVATTVAAACSDAQTCTPGEQNACVCDSGEDGAQTCSADGSAFGACECGGGSGGSGGGTSSGGGGSAPACEALPVGTSTNCQATGPIDATRIAASSQNGVACSLPAELYGYTCNDGAAPQNWDDCIVVDGIAPETAWCQHDACVRSDSGDLGCGSLFPSWSDPKAYDCAPDNDASSLPANCEGPTGYGNFCCR